MDGIDNLSPEERKIFERELDGVLYDRKWCSENGLDYSSPNIKLARQVLYHQMYTKPKFFNSINSQKSLSNKSTAKDLYYQKKRAEQKK
jgi:hypothetical protein